MSPLVASACGGGGGGGSGAPAPPVNTAPSLSVADSFSILEGSLSVGSASASDAQGNTLTYTLSGTDAELFSISASGTISFKTAPDYESPTDSDANNDYELSLSVSDGSLSARATTIINVADAFEGRVVDGPVAGASVFIDLNGDSQQDADEPSSATDSGGYFFVEGFTATDARIIASGGTDTVTNADLSDVALVADVPSDTSKVASVTPITTVLAGAETEEQKNQVLAALGVSGSVEELLTTDHWALAESGDTNAQAIQATNQQIAIVLQTAVTIIESDTSTTQVAATTVATSVAEQVTNLATSTGSVDLSSAETVTTLLTNAVETADSAASTAAEVISAVATSVAEVNTLIASDALDPTSAAAATIIETAQTTLQTSVAEVSAGTTDTASFISSNSTSTLFADNTALASQPDFDGDGIADIADLDDDNDGTDDNADAFPLDATETLDTDNDGTGNNADTDDDADGVADTDDAFPLDATETVDTDNDGTGNNADTDDDADGVADTDDAFPLDATETIDTDNDGTGNNADTDDDADGVADTDDAFPVDPKEIIDTDKDGIGNNADTDDDADGVADTNDAFPLDATETLDTDNDGTGNNADTDDDADGVADNDDAFPLNPDEIIDTDKDGIGNNADTDDDADGVNDESDAYPLVSLSGLKDTDKDGRPNDCDAVCQALGMAADTDDDNDGVEDTSDSFPLDSTEYLDTDSDGIGNNADTDDDADGVADTDDVFPLDATETIDTDKDGIGNNADTDDDSDGITDTDDVFPLDANESVDSDSDGIGNNADTDDDNDGVNDESDAYPLISLGGLSDTDNDGRPNDCDADCQALGMAADDDDDGDGIADSSDAYPLVSLGNLTDTDNDGRPNDCDTACQALGMTADADDDNDGVEDALDDLPLDNTETVDTDSDGIGNNADTDDDNDGVADIDDAYPLNADIHTAPTATNATVDLNLLPQTTNTLTASLTSTSQNSRAVTYAIVSAPTNGTLTLSDAATGAFTYSTTATTAAVDSFTFKVNDGVVDSATGTVYINLKTDPLYKYQWHLDNVGQSSFATNAGTTGADLNLDTTIAAGKTGTGIVIAVIDDGLDIAHEDLTDNVVANGSYNYLNASNDPTPTLSADSHGTAVAGIIAARGWNNIGVRGVAPKASLRAFNLLANDSAAGSYSNEANALGAGSSELFGDVSVFNMSYGAPSTSLTPTYSSTVMDQLYAGVTNLRGGKGAIYIASSGNDYYKDATGSNNYSYCGDGTNAGSYKIGCYDVIFDKKKASPYIINVGGLDADGLKAKYSTPGGATWVSAPAGDYGANSSYTSGVYSNTAIAIPYKPAITTTDLSSCMMGGNSSSSSNINAFNDSSNPLAENANCNYRNTMNGTSSAAPMVSGVVALMLEANSALTWRDVKHILATTATQVDTSFSAAATNGINYVNWVTNSAGLKFHPWYGFGAVDATAAVNAATSYTSGSLGSHSFTDWLLSSSGSTNLNDGVLNTLSLTESGSGTVEHVRIAIKISHSEPNHLGFRLESPAGTVVTLLPPLTALATDLSTGTWAYLPTNAFYGESKTGTWKLYIYDHYAGSTGTFAQWGIRFMYR